MEYNPHQPVLLEEALRLLRPRSGERYLDLTAGYGGHAAAIAAQIRPIAGSLTLIERDVAAVRVLERRFGSVARIIQAAFADVLPNLEGQYDIVLADLGLSSPQLDSPGRGFSFREAGPLDMRMDQRQELSAATIVNHYSERDLADLLYCYGEERQSRRIARALVAGRPFTDTLQLAEAVRRAYAGHSRIHPATRSFQALRIAVNDELGQLERGLPQIERLLSPGGRAAIISFHSLEDRQVKHWIRAAKSLCAINKKVVMGKNKDVSNPRARSAKLRAAVKT